jgi:hypothetical protein
VKWKFLLALGVVAGGFAYAARRRNQQSIADADRWHDVTDPVARFGD